jgi:hypothetical protein
MPKKTKSAIAAGKHSSDDEPDSTGSSSQKITTYLKMIPKLTYENGGNWSDWKEQVEKAAYWGSWPDHLLDIDGSLGPWDGVEEKDPTEKQMRKDAYI